MPLIELLPNIPAKQIKENGNQYYINQVGNRLPSVTTILNATKPQADRQRLFDWRQRVGATQANKIASSASRRGTQTHKQIQRYLLGKDTPCLENSLPYWESIKPVLQNIDTVRLVEGSIFHDDLGYSGKVDCVAIYKGIPVVCEWKTADKPKSSISSLYEYPLQLAAYVGAVNYNYQDYGMQLDHAMLAIAIPDTTAQVFWFEPLDIQKYWQQWVERVKAYWQLQT